NQDQERNNHLRGYTEQEKKQAMIEIRGAIRQKEFGKVVKNYGFKVDKTGGNSEGWRIFDKFGRLVRSPDGRPLSINHAAEIGTRRKVMQDLLSWPERAPPLP
ncbi:MAG: hypothetical protein AABW41_04205, partial [Nanoarchaeota archaeon]